MNEFDIRKQAFIVYPEELVVNEYGELIDHNSLLRVAYIKGYTDAINREK